MENGGLIELFFWGKNGDGRLKHDKFVEFMRDLHYEVSFVPSSFFHVVELVQIMVLFKIFLTICRTEPQNLMLYLSIKLRLMFVL